MFISTAGGVAVNMSTFGMTVGGHFILDDVNCTGNESNIFDCSFPLNTDCRVSRGEEAGVICGGTHKSPLFCFFIMKCWSKGIDGRCTEDLLNETVLLDGSNFTNLTAGRYCYIIIQ